jgi:hypothetical protein
MKQMSNNSSPAVKAMLKKEVEETKIALEKLQEKTPKATMSRAHIHDAIDAAQNQETARVLRAKTATDNAKLVHEHSMEVMKKQVAAMNQMMADMGMRYEETQTQWREKHVRAAEDNAALIAELQQRLVEVNTASAEMNVDKNTQVIAGTAQPDPTDLGIFFAAKAIDAVDKHGQYLVGQVPPNETVRAMLGTALAFYQAWPAHLPKSPTTFKCIGMRPCDVHDCTGSQIWEACWGSRHEEITCEHYIPYQLLTILGELLQQAHPSVHCSEYSAKGAALYQAVAATAYRKLTA